MKGYVDKNACVGCGMCTGIAPEAFRMGDDEVAEGYAAITADGEAAAKEAKESCPVAAIELR
jgi:ferredoxin